MEQYRRCGVQGIGTAKQLSEPQILRRSEQALIHRMECQRRVQPQPLQCRSADPPPLDSIWSSVGGQGR